MKPKFEITDAEWVRRHDERMKRLQKFVAMDAPDVIITSEVKLVLQARLRVRSERALVWKLFKEMVAGEIADIKINLHVWWLVGVKKMPWEEAVSEACMKYARRPS